LRAAIEERRLPAFVAQFQAQLVPKDDLT
jgi:hypothetical protein